MRSYIVMFVLALCACGPSEQGPGNGDGGGNGGPDADPSGTIDAPPGQIFDALNFVDSNCGLQQEDIELINNGDPPDMLIVLDRSGSMSTPIDLFDPFGPTKWAVMKTALQTITEDMDQNIRFGISMFPTDDLCGVAAGPGVPIALNNSGPIVTHMSQGPNGNTPAHLGLQDAISVYQSITPNPAGRFVLFATDGIPNCGGNPPVPDTASDSETVAAVTSLANMGINTFVLGFGDQFGLPVDTLNDAALAGGVPKPGGPPHYYPAANAMELATALEQIAGGIIVPTCEYTLTEPPPDPDAVTVTIDGVPVPRDLNHNNGWDYYPDSMTITFFGTYCANIENGSVTEVAFSYGCPGPVIE